MALSLTVGEAQNKQINLEDIIEKSVFSAKSVPGFNFMNDGSSYSKRVKNKIVKIDIATGQEKEVLFDAEGILPNGFDQYRLSANETKIILFSNSQAQYRHSFYAIVSVLDLKTKKLTTIYNGAKIMYPELSPDESKISFVFQNNLCIQDLVSNKITQVTKDGKQNEIINAASDWVYEEEFVLTSAHRWSPDSKSIAFIRFDESKVKQFTLEYYKDKQYPEPYQFKYPKVGEKNSDVSLWIYKIKSKKLKNVDLNGQMSGEYYIPRLQWTRDPNILSLTILNRWQNHLKLLAVNTESNAISLLLEEKNKYYVDVHDNLYFLNNGSQFLWSSEKDGYNQLYLHSMKNNEVKQLSYGSEEMTEFYGFTIDEKRIYYQRTAQRGLERKLVQLDIESGKSRVMTMDKSTTKVQMSPGAKYFVFQQSDINTPPVISIRDQEGNLLKVLEDNQDLKQRLKEYQLSTIHLTGILNRNAQELNALMIFPPNFDSTKKHPVFMHLYGGPGSQQVLDSWNAMGNFGWFQMLAQKGYIILVVDNRGTGGKGEEFKKMTYLQLGKYETEDQIDAAKYMASLKFVDPERIGIFGWSYGGYMSSLCLLKGNDVFKSAIAVAPVTNWKWYDSIYTERYMKDDKENKAGYDENSPVNFTDRLKGNYLLAHGLADDNVHFQNAAEMINALVKNKKQFDLYVYPNRNHGIYGDNARYHLYDKMTQFILTKI